MDHSLIEKMREKEGRNWERSLIGLLSSFLLSGRGRSWLRCGQD